MREGPLRRLRSSSLSRPAALGRPAPHVDGARWPTPAQQRRGAEKGGQTLCPWSEPLRWGPGARRRGSQRRGGGGLRAGSRESRDGGGTSKGFPPAKPPLNACLLWELDDDAGSPSACLPLLLPSLPARQVACPPACRCCCLGGALPGAPSVPGSPSMPARSSPGPVTDWPVRAGSGEDHRCRARERGQKERRVSAGAWADVVTVSP